MDTSGPHPATCPHCSQSFLPRRPWQRFDTPACRRAYHKAAGGGDLGKRVAQLEQRIVDLERMVWPLGK